MSPHLPTALTPPPALIPVVVQTPAHSGMGELLTYACDRPLAPGTLVRVPLGARDVLGVVWDGVAELPPGRSARAIAGVLEGITPLDAHWRRPLPRATTSAAWVKWRWPPCRRNCATWGRRNWHAACAARPYPKRRQMLHL